MPTVPRILISVNGGPERSGSFRVEGGGQERYRWEGEIDAEHYPGERHPIAITTAENTYTGEAMFTVCDYEEGRVVSRFQGHGALLPTPRSEDDEHRRKPETGPTSAERAVLAAAKRWYDDHAPWPEVGPGEPEFDLKTAVEALPRGVTRVSGS